MLLVFVGSLPVSYTHLKSSPTESGDEEEGNETIILPWELNKDKGKKHAKETKQLVEILPEAISEQQETHVEVVCDEDMTNKTEIENIIVKSHDSVTKHEETVKCDGQVLSPVDECSFHEKLGEVNKVEKIIVEIISVETDTYPEIETAYPDSIHAQNETAKDIRTEKGSSFLEVKPEKSTENLSHTTFNDDNIVQENTKEHSLTIKTVNEEFISEESKVLNNLEVITSVSYTHLDVYKRQVYSCEP